MVSFRSAIVLVEIANVFLADRTRVHLVLSVPSVVSASVQLPRIGCRLELGRSRFRYLLSASGRGRGRVVATSEVVERFRAQDVLFVFAVVFSGID